MKNTDPTNDTAAFILRAGIQGITKSYIDRFQMLDANDSMALSDYIPMLVLEEMLVELSDKHRNYKAYKTTQRGMQFLKIYERMAELPRAVAA